MCRESLLLQSTASSYRPSLAPQRNRSSSRDRIGSEMKEVVGRPGTRAGLVLRVSQCLCAVFSIAAMVTANCSGYYTAYVYLIASMGLQLLWSFGLACLDIYSLKTKRDLHNPVLVSLFVVGDWVTAILSFAAASASAGVTILFERDVHFCRMYPQLSCGRYELSVILAFITWSFIATSAVAMFWLLPSL